MSLLRCIEEIQNRFYQTWLTIGGFCGIINKERILLAESYILEKSKSLTSQKNFLSARYKMTQIFANTSRMVEIFNVMNW